jgi:starch synthase
LKDTVIGIPERGATGIVFEAPEPDALYDALQQALALYKNSRKYRNLQQRGMAQVFDWQQAAISYVNFYCDTLATQK